MRLPHNAAAVHMLLNRRGGAGGGPSGPQTLYMHDGANVGAVYHMPIDGSADPELLFDEAGISIRQLSVDPAGGFIYYAVYGFGGANEGVRRRVLADGSAPTTLLGATGYAWGCWVDPDNDRVYFSTGNNNISWLPIGGGAKTDLYTGVSNPGGLCIDPVSGRLYAACQGTGRVTRGTVGGAARVNYNAASSTNFDFVTHGGGYIFAGGQESGGGGFRRYAEAFTASDGTETAILGALSVSGAVWHPTQERLIYSAADRIIRSCLPDGTDVQVIRDISGVLTGAPYNLAIG